MAEQLDASRALGLSKFVRPLSAGQWLTGRARWACLNCPRLNPPGDSEERDDPDDQDDRDQEDVDDDSDRDRSSWEYFDLRALGPDQLATALEDGHIDDGHVRIRTDPYDWLS